MKRKTGVPRKNYRRLKRLREEQFGGEYRDYIISLPCDVCGVVGYSDPAHLKTRGSGGKASVLAPLCGPHNRLEREWGRTIATLYPGCHHRYDTTRWTLPEGTEERLKKLAAERWQQFSGRVTRENET